MKNDAQENAFLETIDIVRIDIINTSILAVNFCLSQCNVMAFYIE